MQRVSSWRVPALLVAAAALVFLPTVSYSFLAFDDGATITRNPLLRSASGLLRLWTTLEGEQYYPLTWTTHALELRILGERPAGFHALNVALHLVNALLVLAVLGRIGVGRLGATVGAILFALHPCQAMTVAWVAERKNLLSTALALSALLVWMRPGAGGRSRAAAAILFALALLSKSAVAPLVCAFYLHDRRVGGHSVRGSLARVAPLLLLALLSFVPTLLSERKFTDPVLDKPIATRSMDAAWALGTYARMVVWPRPLAPVYPPREAIGPFRGFVLPLVAIAAALVLALLARRRGRRTPQDLLLLFAVLLVPILGLVPYGNLLVTPVSDHYLYLPLAVAGLGVALALEAAGSRWRKRLALLASAWLMALLVLTLAHMGTFRDSASFFSAARASVPGSFLPEFGLGDLAFQGGDFEKAARHFADALRARPREHDARRRLADALLRTAQPERAQWPLLELRGLPEHAAAAEEQLGWLALRGQRFEEASAHLERSTTADPLRPWAWYLRGVAARGVRDEAAALHAYEKVLSLDPGFDRASAAMAHLFASAESEDLRRPDAARALLAQTSFSRTSLPLAGEAEAWLLWEAGRTKEAAAALGRLARPGATGAGRIAALEKAMRDGGPIPAALRVHEP